MSLLRTIVTRLRSALSGGSDMTNEALNNRLDVKAMHNPMLQGGSHDWMTYRRRDGHNDRTP